MTACAKTLGREPSTCTRGRACICRSWTAEKRIEEGRMYRRTSDRSVWTVRRVDHFDGGSVVLASPYFAGAERHRTSETFEATFEAVG